MKEVVIVDVARTPIGSFGGVLPLSVTARQGTEVDSRPIM